MFESARLKLSAWYVVMIMFVSFVFSGVVYQASLNEASRFEQLQRYKIERMNRLTIPLPVNIELLAETKRRAVFLLTLMNGGILVISSILSYVLAGRTLTPIQEMVEDQHRFVSDASHELKTPLTSLKSAFEVYLRDRQRKLTDADELVQESITEVDKLQYLSESLFKLSRGKSSQNAIKMERVALDEIATVALKKTTPLADRKNIQLRGKLTKVAVLGNKTLLTDLIVILLDNAIKYTSADGAVKLLVKKTKTEGVITVSDTGAGIGKKDLPHIFDRFFRSDKARARENTGGYGLGLSIAKQTVEQHSGKIDVKSKLNQGTTVDIQLPLA